MMDTATRTYELFNRLAEDQRIALSALTHPLVVQSLEQAYEEANRALCNLSTPTKAENLASLGLLYVEQAARRDAIGELLTFVHSLKRSIENV